MAKTEKSAKMTITPWSLSMMFTEQKIYEKLPRNDEKGPKKAEMAKNGQ